MAGRRASLGGQGDSAVAAPAAAGTIRHVTQALDKLTPDRDAPRWVLRGGSRWRTALYLGVLLAALAVQLMVDGLAELGVITTAAH